MSGLTPKRATGVALALVVLVGIAIAFFAFSGKPHDDTDVDHLIGSPRVELMPQDSPEWLERHYFDKEGNERKTEISYRNGDVGLRIYRADRTLARMTVTNKDLITVASADYAADGKQVIRGFALRDDLSKAWEANLVGTDIETTMYWSNGKVFGKQIRGAGKPDFRGIYFREDGTKWLEHSGIVEDIYTVSVWRVQSETLYDDAGTVVTFKKIFTPADGITLYQWFNTDGTLAYQQWWRDYGWGRTLTDMDEGAPERVKLKGEIMKPEPGIAKTTVIWLPDAGPVEHIIDTLDDGTQRERVITQDSWQDVPQQLYGDEEPQQTDVTKEWMEQTLGNVRCIPLVSSE